MCTAEVALGLQVVNLGYGLFSGMQQQNPNAAIYRYQQQLAQNQAVMANQMAQRALDQAAHDERKMRRKASTERGTRAAMLAAQGVALDSGSPLDILEDMAEETEFNALEIKADGEMEAWRHRRDAYSATADAQLLGYRAQSSRSQFDPFATVLSHAPGMLSTTEEVFLSQSRAGTKVPEKGAGFMK